MVTAFHGDRVDEFTCSPCNSRSFCIDNQQFPCPLNSTSDPSQFPEVIEECICDPGFLRVSDTCVVGQPPAYYFEGRAKNCSRFRETTVALASTSSACVCVAGYAAYPWNEPCAACTKGTYQPHVNSTICLHCPENSFHQETASVNRTDCLCDPGHTGADGGPCSACAEGFVKNVSGSALCSACPINSHSDGPGNRVCTPCHADSTTAGQHTADVAGCLCDPGFEPNGTNACQACAAGKFKNTSSNDACQVCPAEHYQDLSQATACNPCINISTHVSDHTACQCLKGFTDPSGGVDLCHEDYPNFEKIGASRQIFQPQQDNSFVVNQDWNQVSNAVMAEGGSTDDKINICMNKCIAHENCQAWTFRLDGGKCYIMYTLPPTEEFTSNGWYSNTDGGTYSKCTEVPPNGQNCEACVSGFYKDALGPDACTECVDPYHTSRTAAVHQSECFCVMGYEGNQIGCDACVAGKYKDFVSDGTNEDCIDCPSGADSPEASISEVACQCNPGLEPDGAGCLACAPGSFKEFQGDYPCALCPQNTFQDSSQQTACINCMDSASSPNGSTTVLNCTCNVGSVTVPPADGAASHTCSSCPPGQKALPEGCVNCSSTEYSTEYGSLECLACSEVWGNNSRSFYPHTFCQCEPGFTCSNEPDCSMEAVVGSPGVDLTLKPSLSSANGWYKLVPPTVHYQTGFSSDLNSLIYCGLGDLSVVEDGLEYPWNCLNKNLFDTATNIITEFVDRIPQHKEACLSLTETIDKSVFSYEDYASVYRRHACPLYPRHEPLDAPTGGASVMYTVDDDRMTEYITSIQQIAAEDTTIFSDTNRRQAAQYNTSCFISMAYAYETDSTVEYIAVVIFQSLLKNQYPGGAGTFYVRLINADSWASNLELGRGCQYPANAHLTHNLQNDWNRLPENGMLLSFSVKSQAATVEASRCCHTVGCEACPADSYKTGFGFDSCTDCQDHAQSSEASTQEPDCKCNRGFQQNGSSVCVECPPGQYSDQYETDDLDALVCASCSDYTFTNPVPADGPEDCHECALCNADEYWNAGCRVPDNNTDAECESCPPGLAGNPAANRDAMPGSLNEGPDACLCTPGVYYDTDPYVWPRVPDLQRDLLQECGNCQINNYNKWDEDKYHILYDAPHDSVITRSSQLNEETPFLLVTAGTYNIMAIRIRFQSAAVNGAYYGACGTYFKYSTTSNVYEDANTFRDEDGNVVRLSGDLCSTTPKTKIGSSGNVIAESSAYSNGNVAHMQFTFYVPSVQARYLFIVAYHNAEYGATAEKGTRIEQLQAFTMKTRNEGCNYCRDGSYKPIYGQHACTACPFGTDTQPCYDATGNCDEFVDCLCAAGFFLNTSNVCEKCGVGFAKISINSVDSCTACPSNENSWDATGQTQITGVSVCTCDPGFSRVDGTCTPCLSGTSKDIGGDQACTSCPSGEYQDEHQATECKTCQANSTSTEGLHRCTCDAGFQNHNGTSYHPDGTQCQACVDGSTFKYTNGDERCSVCTPLCDANTRFQAVCVPNQDLQCQACQDNSNIPSQNLAEYCFCNAGFEFKIDQCEACAIGKAKASNSNNSISCKSCIEGSTYAHQTGLPECLNCKLQCENDGLFTDQRYVSAECTITSNTQCSTCQNCPAGQYELAGCGLEAANDRNDTVCATCPANSYCPGGDIRQPISCGFEGVNAAGSDDPGDCLCNDGYFVSCIIPPYQYIGTGYESRENPLTSKQSNYLVWESAAGGGTVLNFIDEGLLQAKTHCYDNLTNIPCFAGLISDGYASYRMFSVLLSPSGTAMHAGVWKHERWLNGAIWRSYPVDGTGWSGSGKGGYLLFFTDPFQCNTCSGCTPENLFDETPTCSECGYDNYCTAVARHACPANSITHGTRSTHILDCQCIRGHHRVFSADETSFTCPRCEPGDWCFNNSAYNCSDARMSTTHPAFRISNCTCEDGWYNNDDDTVCIACPRDSYCQDGARYNCSAAHWTNNLENVDNPDGCLCRPGLTPEPSRYELALPPSGGSKSYFSTSSTYINSANSQYRPSGWVATFTLSFCEEECTLMNTQQWPYSHPSKHPGKTCYGFNSNEGHSCMLWTTDISHITSEEANWWAGTEKTYIYVPGNEDICVPCPVDTYCPGDESVEACPDHSASASGSVKLLDCKCKPGFGHDLSDTDNHCTQCVNGTTWKKYSGNIPCHSCTICNVDQGEYIDVVCTTRQNAQCAPCDPCVNGTSYVSEECAPYENTVCSPCDECDYTDEYRHHACFVNRNSQCLNITRTPCIETGEYRGRHTQTTDSSCHQCLSRHTPYFGFRLDEFASPGVFYNDPYSCQVTCLGASKLRDPANHSLGCETCETGNVLFRVFSSNQTDCSFVCREGYELRDNECRIPRFEFGHALQLDVVDVLQVPGAITLRVLHSNHSRFVIVVGPTTPVCHPRDAARKACCWTGLWRVSTLTQMGRHADETSVGNCSASPELDSTQLQSDLLEFAIPESMLSTVGRCVVDVSGGVTCTLELAVIDTVRYTKVERTISVHIRRGATLVMLPPRNQYIPLKHIEVLVLHAIDLGSSRVYAVLTVMQADAAGEDLHVTLRARGMTSYVLSPSEEATCARVMGNSTRVTNALTLYDGKVDASVSFWRGTSDTVQVFFTLVRGTHTASTMDIAAARNVSGLPAMCEPLPVAVTISRGVVHAAAGLGAHIIYGMQRLGNATAALETTHGELGNLVTFIGQTTSSMTAVVTPRAVLAVYTKNNADLSGVANIVTNYGDLDFTHAFRQACLSTTDCQYEYLLKNPAVLAYHVLSDCSGSAQDAARQWIRMSFGAVHDAGHVNALCARMQAPRGDGQVYPVKAVLVHTLRYLRARGFDNTQGGASTRTMVWADFGFVG